MLEFDNNIRPAAQNLCDIEVKALSDQTNK